MRKLLLLLFIVHCGLMAFSVPQVVGHTHGQQITFFSKLHKAHFQTIAVENDIDDELEEAEAELKSTPLFHSEFANIVVYILPIRSPGGEYINHIGFKLTVPQYLLFQQFII